MRQELCNYGNLLLRGTRIIIPKELRKRVLELAHEGHQGIVKTKSMFRMKVWWPGMDKEAERLCRTCHGCQVNSKFSRPEPITRTLSPSGAWQDCAIDILGPPPTGENIFVIVNFEAVIMKTVTSATIVKVLEGIFCRLDLPYSLRITAPSSFPMLFRTSYVTTASNIDGLLHLRLGKMERVRATEPYVDESNPHRPL